MTSLPSFAVARAANTASDSFGALTRMVRPASGQVRRMRSAVRERVGRMPWMPRNWLPSFHAARILWRDYGHLRSVRLNRAVDAAGDPIPWYTYPAIEFLSQIDFRNASVFEYGSGMSTLFWTRVAADVTSVEDDEQWHETVVRRLPPNGQVILEPDLAEFPHVIHRSGRTYDVIVVDGPARGRTRFKCCRQALTRLNEGGLLILDNSDWLPESSQLLRDAGLLEVDMTGFAPISQHVQTTSLYFHRQFSRGPLGGRQPKPGHGARLELWERPLVPVGQVVWCDGEPFRDVRNDRTMTVTIGGAPRTFRVLTYLGGDETRTIAILDVDRDRVLLTRHTPDRSRGAAFGLDEEVSRIAAMSGDELVAFVAPHEFRRYILR